MKKLFFKWIRWFLAIGCTIFILCILSKTVMQLVDIQYTMNAIWNVKAFGPPLDAYKKQHGEFPQASTLAELQEILAFYDFPFKKSNPPLCEIQYSPAVTQERPYLCYWESNEKWGIFRFLLPKHRRHQLLLMWEDFSVYTSYIELDEFIKKHREYLVWQEEHRYRKK